MDKRLEELLRKEFSFINPIMLEELLMKLESRSIINVFRVSKTKKMIVLNKRNQHIKSEIMEELN